MIVYTIYSQLKDWKLLVLIIFDFRFRRPFHFETCILKVESREVVLTVL